VNVGGDVAEHAEVVRVVHDTADVVHLVAVQHLLSLPFVSQYKLFFFIRRSRSKPYLYEAVFMSNCNLNNTFRESSSFRVFQLLNSA